jgi:hypothetical protein
VWVGTSGDSDTSNLPERDGIQAAGPIWQAMILEMHKNQQFAALLNGPDGQPIAKEFPVPAEAYQGDICSTTGHKPGGGETKKEWLVKGQEPTLACVELTPLEKEELDKAIAAGRKRGVRWASGAIDSIRRYANGVGGNFAPIQQNTGNQGGPNNQGNQSAPIEPVDNGNTTDPVQFPGEPQEEQPEEGGDQDPGIIDPAN